MKQRRQLSEYWFRLRHRFWCEHYVHVRANGWAIGGFTLFTSWRIVDGMRKMRYCKACGRMEWA